MAETCGICGEPAGSEECGHETCARCGDIYHVCDCAELYCGCTEASWAIGADGNTYCSQDCAEMYGYDEDEDENEDEDAN